MTTDPKTPRPLQPLRGIRIVSLALNLPGPAALMRLAAMGARCLKVEPPGRDAKSSGDPMGVYSPDTYAVMHKGIKTRTLDLKVERGQAALHRELAKADVLLTSFRPSALKKLGLDWPTLHKAHPNLSVVDIVGAPGVRAEEPGHDLTYLAEAGLVNGTDLPPSLLADMAGSLVASEAVLQAVLHAKLKGKASHHTVALADAAQWLALPRTWGLTLPSGMVGGAHAGYRVYACKNGRVAAAALEPHFAERLCVLADIDYAGIKTMLSPATRDALAAFFLGHSRTQLDKLALAHDIPLHTLPTTKASA